MTRGGGAGYAARVRSLRSLFLIAVVVAGGLPAQGKKPVPAACRQEFVVTPSADTTSVTLTVVIPGDWRGRQTLRRETFDPQPKQVLGEAGTRYAVFELAGPGKREPLAIRIDSELDLWPPALGVPKPKKGEDDGGEAAEWLRAEPFVESEDPRVVAAARSLAGKQPDDLVRSATGKVLAALEFGGFAPTAVGAGQALELGRGDCSEYSDLLVALLRARQVPARHIQGFTTDWTDTPKHSWVEAHVPGKGWTMLDPTRADTDPEALTGPRANYVWLSPRRNDDRLAGHHYYRYTYQGGAAEVRGSVTLRVGKTEKSAAL